MAVIFNNEKRYEGAVLKIEGKYWLDGMYEERAICWDSESQTVKRVTFGYYGIDGSNLAGGSAVVDATPQTWREILRSFKPSANEAFAKNVLAHKSEIRVGTHASVVRGKKVPKGTVVEVFWIGQKPTFQSRQYSWVNETETIAGCYDQNGNKLWIKAEYLKNEDEVKSPNAKERRKFIKDYMDRRAKELGAPWI